MKVKTETSDHSDDSNGSEGKNKKDNMEMINGQEFDVIEDQLQ